jgi:hypothetical protein
MLRYRTQGALAVGLGILATGCLSEPELKTNLRPEGPPEVLAVLAVDPAVTGHEGAAFCKYVGTTLDEKGPGLVQGSTICPPTADEFEAEGLFPLAWDIRVVFDELLEGDVVEELICDVDGDGVTDDPIETCDGTIANTRPVTLSCGGTTINYDGYYYPNGNKESFPVGPALYVTPDPADLTFATGTECNITITDVVVDKQGERVASAANSFDISIQELSLFQTDPEDGSTTPIAPDGAVAFAFNADLDAASVDAAELSLVDSQGAAVAFDFAVDSYNGGSDAIYIFGAAELAPGTYTASLNSGASFTELNTGTVTLQAAITVEFTVEAP